MTLAQVHNVLKNGEKVFWGNDYYEVRLVKNRDYLNQDTLIDGYLLEIIHTPNGWGGLAFLVELNDCYVK
jgi:hypothetical protein